MTSQEFLLQLEDRGRQRWLMQGQVSLLVHQFERRIARPLTEAERATVRERFDSVGPSRLGDVVLDMRPAELSAWLSDPDAK